MQQRICARAAACCFNARVNAPFSGVNIFVVWTIYNRSRELLEIYEAAAGVELVIKG